MGARLMAIVAEGDRGRVYLAPTQSMKRRRARKARPEWRPELNMPAKAIGFHRQEYGLDVLATSSLPASSWR